MLEPSVINSYVTLSFRHFCCPNRIWFYVTSPCPQVSTNHCMTCGTFNKGNSNWYAGTHEVLQMLELYAWVVFHTKFVEEGPLNSWKLDEGISTHKPLYWLSCGSCPLLPQLRIYFTIAHNHSCCRRVDLHLKCCPSYWCNVCVVETINYGLQWKVCLRVIVSSKSCSIL